MKKLKQVGFTDVEKQIMSKIIDIHSSYITLEKQHPSDISEWVSSIHELQKILGMRMLRREYPDIFPTYHYENNII